jgi:C4-dicarboxylate-specific signal transduction histidine kinase
MTPAYLAAESLPLTDALAQFGAAGLMGALWVWERLHSRLREQQLSQAHDRLTAQRESLDALCELVRESTRATERCAGAIAALEAALRRINQPLAEASKYDPAHAG